MGGASDRETADRRKEGRRRACGLCGSFLVACAVFSLPCTPIALVLSCILMLEIMETDVLATFALLLRFLDGLFYF